MEGGERPSRCALGNRLPEARCAAEIDRELCQLCVRAWGMPWSDEPAGRGWHLPALRSIQIRETGRKPHRWAVAVLLAGRMVDPQFPTILCRTKRRAISLALRRARQLEPEGGRPRKWKIGPTWRVGRLLVTFKRVGM